METVVLAVHVVAGGIAIVCGFVALATFKGSAWHRRTGNAFAVAMLLMGSGAAVLGHLHSSTGDLYGGLLVIYLVMTAWLTLARAPGQVGVVEYAATVFIVFMAGNSAFSAWLAGASETGTYDGRGLIYHVLVAVVLGAWAVGDLRNILRPGMTGRRRLVRHLGRMCFAVFGAAGPIFLARLHVFPDYVTETAARYLLMALPFVPLLVMPYWVVRLWRGGGPLHPPCEKGLARTRVAGVSLTPAE